MIAQSKAIH